MIVDLKIDAGNSTVNDDDAGFFDWGRFCWDGSEQAIEKCPLCDHQHILSAPEPYADSGLIAKNCEYIHVPYQWADLRCVYRIWPINKLYAGKKYEGKRIIRQSVIKKDDGWYWRLELKE